MTSLALRLRRPSSRQLVERIVYQPQFAASVQALAPSALGKLIRHIGVEDSGELIALASTEQIEKIFDDDLWSAGRPGEEETFDVERFVIWLQVMLEVGEPFTAEKLEELPEDLIVLALQRSILVLNADALQLVVGDDDEGKRTEKALEGSLYEEFDEHMVIARRHDGWDAILAALLALDAHNPSLRRHLLDRCCALSGEYIEDNGSLYDVLTSEQMLEGDLGGERDDRRSSEGFVAPVAAASFLQSARLHDVDTIAGMGRDAVAQMYLRSQRRSAQAARSPSTKTKSNADIAALLAMEALIEKIADEPRQFRADILRLPSAGASDRAQNGDTLFLRVLQNIAEQNPEAHEQTLDELAFLCNVLVSGCLISGRPFRPYEAVIATAATCNLGLERLAATSGMAGDVAGATEILQQDGADGTFRVGFSILHHEVAEKALASIIDRIQKPDSAIRLGQVQSSKIWKAGSDNLGNNKPWQFGENLWDLHELFDGATLEALSALIGEIPLLLGNPLEKTRNIHRLDERFACISTEEDIQNIANFLEQIQAGCLITDGSK